MSAALARTLKLLALLALLLGGMASHDVAMASGAMGAEHQAVAAHHAMTHHGMTDTCDIARCDLPGPPCCVMGQCLLAIPVTDACAFNAATLPDPEAHVLPGRVAGIVRAPFRPPATV
jgi:hypothetical protein